MVIYTLISHDVLLLFGNSFAGFPGLSWNIWIRKWISNRSRSMKKLNWSWSDLNCLTLGKEHPTFQHLDSSVLSFKARQTTGAFRQTHPPMERMHSYTPSTIDGVPFESDGNILRGYPKSCHQPAISGQASWNGCGCRWRLRALPSDFLPDHNFA